MIALQSNRLQLATRLAGHSRVRGSAFSVRLRIKKGHVLPRHRLDGQIGPLVGALLSEGAPI
jgi:hypothetical protein